jgi:hypothetical protein
MRHTRNEKKLSKFFGLCINETEYDTQGQLEFLFMNCE